jgi:hypothetical protein
MAVFCSVLALDGLSSLLLLAPFWPWIKHYGGETLDHYTFYGTLVDLALLACLRLFVSALALLISYFRADVPPEYHFDLHHPNGERKTREELEQESLEEPFCRWICRFIKRPSFSAEVLGVFTQGVCMVKCLSRLNVEIGTLKDSEPFHPIFWLAILLTAIFSAVEASYLDPMCKLAGQLGQGAEAVGLFRTISSTLNIPLLANQEEEVAADEENGEEVISDEEYRAVSDITADSSYKAKWSDLLKTCYPDLHLIALAFVFLLLAAIAQVYIPRFLGKVLDSLTEAFSGTDNDDERRNIPMTDIPGFMKNIKLLVLASVLAGVFAGLRGSIFVSHGHTSVFVWFVELTHLLLLRRLLVVVSMSDYVCS